MLIMVNQVILFITAKSWNVKKKKRNKRIVTVASLMLSFPIRSVRYKMYFRPALLVFLAVCLVFSSGCNDQSVSPAVDSIKEKKGGSYRRAFADAFLMLDPAFIKDSNSHEICRQIFDGLVEFDENANIHSAIAREWKISDDKLVYTFLLRHDVKFHKQAGGKPTRNGGRTVNAEDILFSFKRLLKSQPDSQASFFWVIKGARDYNEGKAPDVEGIRVLASDSIEFTLEKPFAPFVSLLAMCNGFIVPQEDAGDEPGLKEIPVGTGPFFWAGRSAGVIELKANDEYFRGRPHLDRIEFVVIEDEMTRFKAFMNGELMQVDVPDSQYRNVKQNPLLSKHLLEASMWGTNYLGMNLKEKPFDNLLIRKALNYAIDRETIVRLVLNDRAQVANGILPPGIPGHDFELAGYNYDLPKAKKLLDEAGFPEGKGLPVLTLHFNRDAIHARTAEFIMANLKDLGVSCVAKELEFGEHLSAIEEGRAGFFRLGWNVDYPDPDNFLYTLFHSSNIGAGYNFSNLSLPELDAILDQARFETEMLAREKLYQQAEKLIVEHAPWVFLYFYTSHLLHQPEVKGLTLGPMGESLIQYRRIWLDRKISD